MPWCDCGVEASEYRGDLGPALGCISLSRGEEELMLAIRPKYKKRGHPLGRLTRTGFGDPFSGFGDPP